MLAKIYSHKKILFFIWGLGLFSNCRLPFLLRPSAIKAQNASPHHIANLSDSLRETSGLIFVPNNTFWSQNDGGNTATLFSFDSLGAVRRRVAVNAPNTDWEEIALTPSGNLLIGDFGNNAQNRQDLKMLRLPNFSTQTADTLNAEAMPFRYEDQTAFPPPLNARYFDAEAMLAWSDSIYIFTKDFDNQPYTGISRIYRLPTSPNNWQAPQVAKLVHILPTDPSWKYYGAVTGAAKNADGSKVVLLTYSRLFLYTNFSGKAFWQGTRNVWQFNSLLQREAVAFKDDCTIFITCEQSPLGSAAFYSLNLCDLQTKNKDIQKIKLSQIHVLPNPSVTDIQFRLEEPLPENGHLRLINLQGKVVFDTPLRQGIENMMLSRNLFAQSLDSDAIYIWQISAGSQSWIGKIVLK
jgi:hypothetical protein